MKMNKLETATAAGWRHALAAIGPSLQAHGERCDDDDQFVADNLEPLKNRGFTTLAVPSELGGGGESYGETCAMLEALAAYCPSTALALSMHTHQVVVPAWRWRHEKAPVEGLLRRVADERLILVSSGGSDWLEGSGVAERVEGGYRITARKVFASGSPSGDLLMTSAVHQDPQAGPTVIHFPLSLRDPAVRFLDNWRTLGMRGTGSQDIAIDKAFIPDAAVGVRRPQGKWHPLFHLLSLLAMPLIYSVYAGIAAAARDRAVEIARKRPTGAGLIEAVGELDNRLLATRLAHRHMVGLAETVAPGPQATAAVMAGRTLVGRSAIATVDKAMEVAGGAGFYRATGLERLFRDVQAARYHPLQSPVQAAFGGRVALGLDIDG